MHHAAEKEEPAERHKTIILLRVSTGRSQRAEGPGAKEPGEGFAGRTRPCFSFEPCERNKMTEVLLRSAAG